MLIHKAYKFRLYPNIKQQEMINKTFGCARLVYNYYLNKKQELYNQKKKNLSCYDMCKDLKNLSAEKYFLKEVDSMALRTSLFDLDDAYHRFFKEKKGYPKYKNKYGKNSYRTNLITKNYKGHTYTNIKLDLENKTITLPKLKEVKIRGYRNLKEINGRIIMFKECLKNNIMPFIVLDEDKSCYMRGLKEYENDKMFLIDTIKHEQDIYESICKELLNFKIDETE